MNKPNVLNVIKDNIIKEYRHANVKLNESQLRDEYCEWVGFQKGLQYVLEVINAIEDNLRK